WGSLRTTRIALMQINKGETKPTPNQAVASQSSLLSSTEPIDEDQPTTYRGLTVLIAAIGYPMALPAL
ncbi:MAG: hypothetical protein WA669_17155, partial [Pseudolabrys sp.]